MFLQQIQELDILHEAHYSIHPGSTKMYNDLKQIYWWLRMKREILEFVTKMKMKASYNEFCIGIVTDSEEERCHMVIVDILTKSAHIIPIKMIKLTELYVSEIVRLNSVPLSIITYRDPRFTFRFWGKLHEALGTKLNFSTTFNPQIDGQFERVIQIFEDMFQCCIIEFEGSWEKFFPLVEFAYNNDSGFDLVQETKEKVRVVRDCLKAASDRQKLYANLKRKDIKFQVGDKVFLNFGRKENLDSRFIGLYEILKRIGPMAYILALPSEPEKIHDVFHVPLLRHYRSDPSHVISLDEVELQHDFSYDEELVKILARDVKELKNK
ncbi:DNA/RNA polymerases superfamily protein [Gossypium australe]|uniref:DNA/RNA polymerases superfamily protein n=1 Tax=Gossypium australe TaxID=47621 RepID=A0A5B6WAB1_9ROSI|nr:DNA/RNA polymerases superfamily protein [Gossypium australe]